MARIPEAEIERLKTEISVARLVTSAGIELRKSGKDQIGKCPFHDDTEPSLVVTAANGKGSGLSLSHLCAMLRPIMVRPL